ATTRAATSPPWQLRCVQQQPSACPLEGWVLFFFAERSRARPFYRLAFPRLNSVPGLVEGLRVSEVAIQKLSAPPLTGQDLLPRRGRASSSDEPRRGQGDRAAARGAGWPGRGDRPPGGTTVGAGGTNRAAEGDQLHRHPRHRARAAGARARASGGSRARPLR